MEPGSDDGRRRRAEESRREVRRAIRRSDLRNMWKQTSRWLLSAGLIGFGMFACDAAEGQVERSIVPIERDHIEYDCFEDGIDAGFTFRAFGTFLCLVGAFAAGVEASSKP